MYREIYNTLFCASYVFREDDVWFYTINKIPLSEHTDKFDVWLDRRKEVPYKMNLLVDCLFDTNNKYEPSNCLWKNF